MSSLAPQSTAYVSPCRLYSSNPEAQDTARSSPPMLDRFLYETTSLENLQVCGYIVPPRERTSGMTRTLAALELAIAGRQSPDTTNPPRYGVR
jgi:hypothetical protein